MVVYVLAFAAETTGVDAAAVLEQVAFLGTSPNAGNAVGQKIKWYAKHGRKNGIHVTPTVLVNGINGAFFSIYALAIQDWLLFTPNAIGAGLATIQILLCLMFP